MDISSWSVVSPLVLIDNPIRSICRSHVVIRYWDYRGETERCARRMEGRRCPLFRGQMG